MVAFSIVGFVLSSRPDLLNDLKVNITKQLAAGGSGSGLGDVVGKVVDSAVDGRVAIFSIGLVVALYSGISWMGNVRQAVQAQWRPDFDDDQEMMKDSFLVTLFKNLWMLIGLGLALVISVVLSSVGNAATGTVLKLVHLDQVSWLQPVVKVVAIAVAVVADLLIFMWVYTVLPPAHQKATRQALFRGSLIAAIAFEVLKFALTFILPKVLTGTTGAVFGPIVGLLFFFNLVATVVLFVAAWIATSEDPAKKNAWADYRARQNEVGPILEPAVVVNDSVSKPKIVGLLGLGAALGFGAALRRRSK